MTEILSYTFMQNAIIAGIIISIMSGIVGSLIVVNRMLFLAGGIAHSVYGGVGVAIFFGLPILLGTTLFAVVAALIIAFLSFKHRHRMDTYIGVLWAFGMALGVLLIDLTPGYQSDLMSYLFGSILAISNDDILYSFILLVFTLLLVLFLYYDLLAISYDQEFARLRGIPVKTLYALMLIMSSLAIVMAIRAVGLIMIIALLSIPAYIAERIATSLAKMMIISTVLALFSTLLGLYLSYVFNLSSGAAIIMVASTCFALFEIKNIKGTSKN